MIAAFVFFFLASFAHADEALLGYWTQVSEKCSIGELLLPAQFYTLYFGENGFGSEHFNNGECDVHTEFHYHVDESKLTTWKSRITKKICSGPDDSINVFDFPITFRIQRDEKGESTLVLKIPIGQCSDRGISTAIFHRIPQG